jgi:hypothetical protein
VWIVAASILWGATLEFLEHWEFHEAIEWRDIVDDAIGATASGLLCRYWLRKQIQQFKDQQR